MLDSSRLSTSASCQLISSCAVSRAAWITSPEFCCRSSLSRLKSPASACLSASRRRIRICRNAVIASFRAILLHLLRLNFPVSPRSPSRVPRSFLFPAASTDLCHESQPLPPLHFVQNNQNIVRSPATTPWIVCAVVPCVCNDFAKRKLLS